MPDNQLPSGYKPAKLTPRQMAEHYGFPVDQYDGKGQKVAILSAEEFVSKEEVLADLAKLGIRPTNLNIVPVDARETPSDTDNTGVNTPESHLDLEVVASICPAADITIYTQPNLTSGSWDELVDAAVKAGNKVISISYGGNEIPQEKNMESFQQAAEAGVTVLVASGDDGSSNIRPPQPLDGKAHASFPATNPFVLACGGTMTDGAGQEVVWNLEAEREGAGGGGVSTLYEVPTWQRKDAEGIVSANPGGGTGRVIPDVAAMAAPGDWILVQEDGTEVGLIGGTSAVAPLMAAFFTLVNQGRAAAGKGAIGFVNDKLYGLSPRDTYFNDITLGNNRSTPDYPGYDAKIGFDACSGLGSPKGAALFKALVDMD